MQWQEILTILVPILGFMGWVYGRIDKKFNCVIEELKLIRNDIQSLDKRLTRLEARFDERGYWESQIRIIKDSKDTKEQ